MADDFSVKCHQPTCALVADVKEMKDSLNQLIELASNQKVLDVQLMNISAKIDSMIMLNTKEHDELFSRIRVIETNKEYVTKSEMIGGFTIFGIVIAVVIAIIELLVK